MVGSNGAGNPPVNLPWRVAVLAVLATAGVGMTWPSAGAATNLAGFTATASAQGGQLDFTVPGFAVVETIADPGGPVSQSAVDSSSALSFASMPYPGGLVISGPGLFAGLTGISPPGDYPFYVSASHPSAPEQVLEDPTGSYRLAAKASPGAASGMAQAQGKAGDGASGGSGGAQAVTSAVVDGDTVTVTARTANEALNLGDGSLRIASVRSASVTTYSAGQPEPVTKTELVIDGGSVGGTTFSFGAEGLRVAGQGVPIPAGSGLDQLNAALAPAGISLRFAGAQKIVGGASADALVISLAGQAPIPGAPPGVITVRLGGATSAVTLGHGTGGLLPPAAGAAGPGDDVFPPLPAGDTTAQGGAAPALPAADGGLGFSSLPSGDNPPGAAGESPGPGGFAAPVTAPDATSSSPATVSDGRGSADVAGLAVPVLHPRRLGSDGILYWVIVGGGMLMLAVSSLWTAKGGSTL